MICRISQFAVWLNRLAVDQSQVRDLPGAPTNASSALQGVLVSLSPHLMENCEWAIIACMELKKEDFKLFDARTRNNILMADPFSLNLVSDD